MQPHGPLTPCCIQKKTNEPIPKKTFGQKDRRTEGWMDRP